MSRNEISVAAPREHVFAFVADPGRYEQWVVGASVAKPLADISVLESEPPERLVLSARLPAVGAMRVTLELDDDPAGGTRVVLLESPDDGLLALVRNPLSDWLLSGRNVVSLRRLKARVEA